MKQFKNGIFQFTKFEFYNKIPLHLLYFGNVVIRTVVGGGKKKAYTVTENEIPHFKVQYLLI